MTKRELIFRRLENEFGPGDALSVLRVVLGDADAHDASQIPSISKTPKRFGPLQ